MISLSIVSTLFNSEQYVEEFCRRAKTAAQVWTMNFEILLVDDGSSDHSVTLARKEQAKDPRIRIVELSRNFGHHRAILTGLMHARGDKVFFIDCDLEEDPNLLSEFMKTMNSSHADSVYGFQTHRAGNLGNRITGYLFYKCYNYLCEMPIPHNMTGVRLMNRRFLEAVIQHRERAIFLAGIYSLVGYQQIGLPIQKQKRVGTSYSWLRRCALMANAIVSFSSRPLEMIFAMGLLISFASVLFIAKLALQYFIYGASVPGYLTVMASVWLLGGIITFCIGLVAIYLSKIFQEVKQRPYTLIKPNHSLPPILLPSQLTGIDPHDNAFPRFDN